MDRELRKDPRFPKIIDVPSQRGRENSSFIYDYFKPQAVTFDFMNMQIFLQ